MKVNHNKTKQSLKPFLRWAGGKHSIIKHLQHLLPLDIHDRYYIEPFLGAGSLFFALQPKDALLSDSNEHLIECFIYVRDYPELISNYLRLHKRKNSEKYYYDVREKYNRSSNSAAQAGRFIYLNKSCFNGIFRVNQKGEFNVPYGWKEPPCLPDMQWLQIASNALKGAIIKNAKYVVTLAVAKKGDFIYLDPPYPPLNNTSNFTHYTKDRFNIADQKQLAEVFKELDYRGCLIMMSNADIPLIRNLYNKYTLHSLPVRRYITCKSIKHNVAELIIKNY
jgi:DNA adenine methylase